MNRFKEKAAIAAMHALMLSSPADMEDVIFTAVDYAERLNDRMGRNPKKNAEGESLDIPFIPSLDSEYYSPRLVRSDLRPQRYFWTGSDNDERRFALGLVFANEDACFYHCRKMIAAMI